MLILAYNAYLSFFSITILIPSSPTCLVFARIVSLLSTIQFSMYVLSPRYTSFNMIEFLITQLFPTNTFLKITEFSIVPLIILPLPTRLFFKDLPSVYSKVSDQPPAKYNPGSEVKNCIVASGCIFNGKVEDSVIFKKVYIGSNTYIKNCIILNDVHIGDNCHLENCIVESRDTIRPNTEYIGQNGEIKIAIEKNERFPM